MLNKDFSSGWVSMGSSSWMLPHGIPVNFSVPESESVTKPMCYVAALHLYRIKIRYQINTVPTPTVAWTRAWLLQGGP